MANKRASMSSQQQQEILGVLLMTLGMLVLASLISYNPTDEPRGFQFLKVENAMGLAGVYISYVLIKILLGIPAIVVPFLLIGWGHTCFRGRSYENMARTTYYVLLAALYVATILGLPQVLNPSGNSVGFSYSGLIGGYLAQNLYQVFGVYGSSIVIVAIGAITIMYLTQMSLTEAYAAAKDRLANSGTWFQERVDSARHWRPAMAERASKKAKAEEPEEAEEELEEGESPSPEPRWKRLARMRENSVEAPPPGAITAQPAPRPLAQRIEAPVLNDSVNAPKAVARDTSEKAPSKASGPDRYEFPPLDLLFKPHDEGKVQTREELLNHKRTLEERLAEFDVDGEVREINPGPVITRYEFEPAPGIKVSRITALADDLALAMRAKRIRIVAPIPGKAAVGIELPNPEPQTVYIRDILESEEFKNSASPLTIALGRTISGKVYVTSLDRMPHLLIAGSTGSGKSVCLNAIILSILYKAHPKEVQFVLVDPKRLELASYRMLRKHHLIYRDDLNEEVVTTAQNALAVLRSLEWEMENRYTLLARVGVRSIAEYNVRLKEGKIVWDENGVEGEEPVTAKPLPYIVLVIDELADLMLTAAKEVEEPIARLTQMARAVGIHLVVATQRPSVDVITGVIKANFPARMAFQVASKIDSRTILDMNGAEKLLGSGDMLFLPPGSPEPVRIHGVFVSSDEIERTIEHIRNQSFYEKNLLPVRTEEQNGAEEFGPAADGRRDELFQEALKLVVRHQQGSISLLQRRLKIGYSRAARLIDELEAAGIVGSFDGSKAREVLVDESYLEEMGLTQ